MTQDELRGRILQISRMTNGVDADREINQLYVDVLRAIANGALRHRLLARDVLQLEEMRYGAARSTPR
jgi:hypothetical protein